MYLRIQNCGWQNLCKRLIYNQKQCRRGMLQKNQQDYRIQPGEKLHGFICQRAEPVNEFNMTAYLLSHETTKTEYLHLERDDTNNVFSIGFRTTPMDSKGAPHILEHTVLCGSEKYPIRDPFFKMLNRSLATFMNAMTGPDYTFYPFASQNEIDYRNLQKVYLDAVFKPNLLHIDFLQEGWRLEHSKLEDKSSNLVFKGVVYNEMKGAFTETGSLFGQKFINTILPEGTYGYVSGGDPLHIPELTYTDLKNFHAKYYHPSNAKIFSYGNFPLDANLQFVNEKYLNQYNYLDPKHTIVKPQDRWSKPRRAETPCRVDQYGSPVAKQNQIAVGYVMSDITDIEETFLLGALSELMILGPNSEFYKTLIEKDISGGYNSLTGYDNQFRDTLFVIGLKDIEKSNFQVVESIVDTTLNDIYKNGFEKDHIESVIHGFELGIKHQSPKFGLNTLFNVMPIWIHGGDMIKSLKVNDLLSKLKDDLSNPEYIKKAIVKHFISNNHKLVMTMEPDSKFEEIFSDAEAKILESKIKALDEKTKTQIYHEGLELSKAQKKIENIEVLPCLKIEEIVLNKTAPELKHSVSGTIPLQLCEANTNGVTYFKGVLGTSCLNKHQRELLPFFRYILDKFDTQHFNYRDFDKFVSKSTSGLGVITHITEHIDQLGQYEQGLLFSSHCLDENVPKMLDIWTEIFNKPRFDNRERLTMLLNNYCSALTSGIIDQGHSYAMQAAKALISPVDRCREDLLGLQHIMTMQNIQKNFKIDLIQDLVIAIGSKILNGKNLRAAFHYSSSNRTLYPSIDDFCANLCKYNTKHEENRINWTYEKPIEANEQKGLHISMNIPVNYCAKVIPTVPYINPDYAKLRVLSRFLTSKYLHLVVREQNGAYGGGALLTMEGVFSFYSYRDPNTKKTLTVFDEAADWVTDNAELLNDQNLYEAKLSILQQMDQPIAEYMKGIDLFLYGLSYDIWKTQRERVLAVTKDDVLEVASKYLKPEMWSGKCVIGKESKGLQSGNEVWDTISGPQQDTS